MEKIKNRIKIKAKLSHVLNIFMLISCVIYIGIFLVYGTLYKNNIIISHLWIAILIYFIIVFIVNIRARNIDNDYYNKIQKLEEIRSIIIEQ